MSTLLQFVGCSLRAPRTLIAPVDPQGSITITWISFETLAEGHGLIRVT